MFALTRKPREPIVSGKRWLLVIVLLQVLWVAATATIKEIARESGTRVLLTTQPVDPRDMLRGDYMTLRFDISDVPRNKVRGEIPDEPIGKRIYVALAPSGKFYFVKSASFAATPPEAGQVVIRGVIDERSMWSRNNPDEAISKRPLSVAYGLERYYVPEGTGTPSGKLTMEVSVAENGESQIREVFLDGKPFREATAASVAK